MLSFLRLYKNYFYIMKIYDLEEFLNIKIIYRIYKVENKSY